MAHGRIICRGTIEEGLRVYRESVRQRSQRSLRLGSMKSVALSLRLCDT